MYIVMIMCVDLFLDYDSFPVLEVLIVACIKWCNTK